MILTIDNLAGAGAVDYSAVLCADHRSRSSAC